VANQGALGGLGIDCKISGPDRIVCFPLLVLLSTKTLLSKIQKSAERSHRYAGLVWLKNAFLVVIF
jgi:hypothetical protein